MGGHEFADPIDVFEAIRARLSLKLSIPPQRIIITQEPDKEESSPVGAPRDYYTLTLGNGVFDRTHWDGGGRNVTTFIGDALVGIFHSTALDKAGSDEIALTRDRKGSLAKLTRVLSALDDWMPTEANDPEKWLLLQGMAPGTLFAPWRQRSNYLAAKLAFEIQFCWKLSDSDA